MTIKEKLLYAYDDTNVVLFKEAHDEIMRLEILGDSDALTIAWFDGFEMAMKRLRIKTKATDATLRLHMGELSAQDIRNIRAAFGWLLGGNNA